MKAVILTNREFLPLHFHLVLAVPHPSEISNFKFQISKGEGVFSFSPGQFAMIGFHVLDPFLPRAFSIYKASHQPSAISHQPKQKNGKTANAATGDEGRGMTRVEFLYKIMGKGSTYLSTLTPGDQVEVMAPLGNSFALPKRLRTAILVAGGIGVPPIVALAAKIARSTWHVAHSQTKSHEPRAMSHEPRAMSQIKMVAFIGGRSKEDVLCIHDFKRAGAEVHVATEDGSMGQKGLITDLLEQYLRATGYGLPAVVYACGPNAMLAAVAGVAEEYHLPCQVSMEATMACGFGACMGCAIPVRPQPPDPSPQTPLYKLCCRDGPVFDAGEIVW